MNTFDLELRIRFEGAGHIGDPVCLIGSLNHWQEKGIFLGNIPEGTREIRVMLRSVPEGLLEFRLSRGGWSAISCLTDGAIGAPFTFNIQQNTTLQVAIAAWRDDFPLATVTWQVHCLSEAFFFPELKVYRKVWIYLPRSYEYAGAKRYPVLYMHDGQHLFDGATAAGRKGPVEWQVDKVINRSAEEAIVVAIAHGGEELARLHDYVVQPVAGMARPGGRQYLDDIIHTLKPYVDAHYRTLADWRYTAMAGSSLGGLLSLYAGLMHRGSFACLGIFSPSLWLDNKQVHDFIDTLPAAEQKRQQQSYYIYGGSLENRKIKNLAPVAMDKAIEHIGEVLAGRLQARVTVNINPVGKHGTLYWQQAFPHFYGWWQEQMASFDEHDAERYPKTI